MSPTKLFSPITLRSTTFRNRLWAAPMCQYSVNTEDGVANDWHLVHLGSLARGGAGAVIVEATAVTPEGRISPQDLGLWNDDQQNALARMVSTIHSSGTAAMIQLAHAGRKASVYRPWSAQSGSIPLTEGGWKTVAPSAIAFNGHDRPQELTITEIDLVVNSFVSAARRSVAAGFDAIEIHAAHGYLIHQFLSPLSNTRSDHYGGSAENRARMLLNIIRTIRSEHTNLPLLVRFSADDYVPGGLDAAQVALFSQWAEQAGADLIDVSSGGLIADAQIPVFPGYQVEYAATIRKAVAIPVSAVGLITEASQAEKILQQQQADIILMGRELLRNPYFPLKAAAKLGETLPYYPPQYRRAPYPKGAI
ncbi:NADH:flavin oxidoreductase/NADH oxidase [Lysinibacter sp. HNR]|uniref:NADH:flavin oxidoreductase/NADH oxidase n=1 Tax=Lysinibacter sp. HNR TaxID=3031408 RepID=UPI002435037B|nr:NADH:flavin oxidoreductase/NADH oxidase [Lysinibacter sp. HNR]WGD36774.1 NADH:flavin oxidoreductase/NADH oxidase [Lysinibacter sp. HNR]